VSVGISCDYTLWQDHKDRADTERNNLIEDIAGRMPGVPLRYPINSRLIKLKTRNALKGV
jgi:hypothetical protein